MEKMTLKQAREAAGLSLVEAAVRAGVTVETVRNWENGKTWPRGFAMIRAAKAYGVKREQISRPHTMIEKAMRDPELVRATLICFACPYEADARAEKLCGGNIGDTEPDDETCEKCWAQEAPK